MTKVFKNLVEMQQQCCIDYQNFEMYGTKNPDGYRFITFKRFGELVSYLRGGLHSLGVTAGDKVAIISKNSVEWATSAYATYGLKALHVPMYESQTQDDWRYIIKDSAAKVLFVSNHEIYQKLKNLPQEIPTLQHVIVIDREPNNKAAPSPSHSPYEELLKTGQDHPVASLIPDTNDPMGLIYTSGTTAFPKGVILSHANLLSNLHAIPQLIDIGPNDRTLAFLPWAHIFGQIAEVHALMYCGFSAGLAEDVTTIVDNLSEVRPTLLFSVPRIFNKIYDGVMTKMNDRGGLIKKLFDEGMVLATRKRKGESFTLKEKILFKVIDKIIFKKVRDRFGGRLKFAVSGASALNISVAEFIDNLGIIILEGYGLSETSPLVSVNSITHRRIGSVGLPITGCKIKIDSAALAGASANSEEGEIVVYGPNVMQGYYNLPEETQKVMTSDGGFRTGDIGRVDKDGYLYITGRIKEQYKLENGKYVIPTLIEDQIKLSPFINNAYLYGDNRSFNVVLLSIDLTRIEKWASLNQLEIKGKDLLKHKIILELIQKEIQEFCIECKSYEKPQRISLTDEDWNVENGLLTPSMKLKRNVVYNKYKNLIESLY